MSDVTFYLVLGSLMTACFMLGALLIYYVNFSRPTTLCPDVEEINDRMNALRARVIMHSDEQLAANNRAYKEFAKRSEAEL